MPITISTQSANYTLALKDADTQITLTNKTNITIKIPTDNSVKFPIGTIIFLQSEGTGVVTISLSTGVILQSLNSARKLGGKDTAAFLIKKATNTWFLAGTIKN